ncbi:hypothetical protein DE146DRAFT_701020 [Phaeosphaeria sp. MPI-PUGE-AT-0046c]|nr:hypothetical protein DE146DRAFT_701020 [Phaeosphaeria sp. MPI-PUGE-AT-0046c]
MSTARVSARALRALTSTSRTTTRSLSITGPTTFSSVITSDKPTGARSNAPRLPASTMIPVPDTTDTGKPVRHFNTSRSLKAVNDSSTIDFMYIPDFDPDMKAAPVNIRVPIIPWTQPSNAARAEATEAETEVMLPTIFTVAADGTHIHAPSAMSDVSDSDHTDFQGLASSMASSVAKRVSRGAEGEGMTRQILGDMWEDITSLGGKQGHVRA